jgi:cytochrome c oxidase assembly protein subunit 15
MTKALLNPFYSPPYDEYMPALARVAWLVLTYNIAVILWGAYVRATGSGAGCGNHWPLCNGEVLPRSPTVTTIIELSHRLTSGLAVLAVVALVIWTLRATRSGHPARLGAMLSLAFILMEAAVGAGLVLFELVADNATMARAMFMVTHLVNTFLLLGALTLTSWWLSSTEPGTLVRRRHAVASLVAGCGTLLLAGASGAVAALGDTLFPAISLGDALAADLSASSHLLLRLRVLHPLLAVTAVLTVVVLSGRLSRGRGESIARVASAVRTLAVLQIVLGLANVVLLAPVWLQLVHLLVADAIWVGFIVLGADAVALASPASVATAGEQRQRLGVSA